MQLTVNDIETVTGSRPNDTMQDLCDAFNKHADDYDINNRLRVSCFLARMCVESGNFKRLEENLNYRADRLRAVWPSRFPDDETAEKYARNPEGLANYVYGNRYGNSDEDDGWKYRGSGVMQVTFKANFQTISDETGIDFVSEPDLMREADHGMLAAMILWKKWGLNDYADNDRISDISRRINGGDHGLSETKNLWSKFLKHFTDDQFE